MSRLLESLTKELTRAVKDGVDEAKKPKTNYVNVIYDEEGKVKPPEKTITDFEIETDEIRNTIGKTIITIGNLLAKETNGEMKLFTNENDVWSGKILSGSSEFLFSRADDVNAEASEIGDVSILVSKEYIDRLNEILKGKIDKKISPKATIRSVNDMLLKGNDEDKNIEVLIELEFKDINGDTKIKGIEFYFEPVKLEFKKQLDKDGNEVETVELDDMVVMLKKMRYDDFKKGIKQVFYKLFLKSIIQAVGHRELTAFFGLQPVVMTKKGSVKQEEILRLNGNIETVKGFIPSLNKEHMKKLTSKYKLNMSEGVKKVYRIARDENNDVIVVDEILKAIKLLKGSGKEAKMPYAGKLVEVKIPFNDEEIERVSVLGKLPKPKNGKYNLDFVKVRKLSDNLGGTFQSIVQEIDSTKVADRLEAFLEIIFGATGVSYLENKNLLTKKRLQGVVGLANLIREAETHKAKGNKSAFEKSVEFRVGIMEEFINLVFGFDTDGKPYVGLLDDNYNKDVQMRNFVVSTVTTGLGVAKNETVKKMLEKARLEYKKYLMEQKNLNEDFGKDFDYVTSTTIIENKLDIKISNELDNFFGSLVESLDVNEDEISDEDLEDVNEKKKKGKKTKLPKKIIDLRKKELAKIKENKDCPDCQKRRKERLDEKKKRKGKKTKLPKKIIDLRKKELAKIKENKDCPDCQKRRKERLDEKKKRKGKKLPKDIIKLRIKELSKIKA